MNDSNEQKLFEELRSLLVVNTLSKHEQIINGVINAIKQKAVLAGGKLPSVNQMSAELGFAKETVVKAYKELINRGIIESRNRRGFFVNNTDTDQQLKVFLLLYAFDTFQETFYQSFKNELGAHVHIDVFFHHNNFSVFEAIINSNKGKYGMYVIAPIQTKEAKRILDQLPTNKLLLVDRYLKLSNDHSYVVQEFEKSSYKAFEALAPRIKEFSEFVFFFKPSSAEPDDVYRSFKKFIKDFDIRGKVQNKYKKNSIVAGKVYFTIHNLELWEILKDAKLNGLIPGKDIGILSHNDDDIKEIIFDGITTFSIDFASMGKIAANYVLTLKPIKHTMETHLIRRNSL